MLDDAYYDKLVQLTEKRKSLGEEIKIVEAELQAHIDSMGKQKTTKRRAKAKTTAKNRGRPKGSKNKVTKQKPTSPAKKRGRPKGSKNKPKQAAPVKQDETPIAKPEKKTEVVISAPPLLGPPSQEVKDAAGVGE